MIDCWSLKFHNKIVKREINSLTYLKYFQLIYFAGGRYFRSINCFTVDYCCSFLSAGRVKTCEILSCRGVKITKLVRQKYKKKPVY